MRPMWKTPCTVMIFARMENKSFGLFQFLNHQSYLFGAQWSIRNMKKLAVLHSSKIELDILWLMFFSFSRIRKSNFPFFNTTIEIFRMFNSCWYIVFFRIVFKNLRRRLTKLKHKRRVNSSTRNIFIQTHFQIFSLTVISVFGFMMLTNL